jgi:lipoprotein-releasing system ATP-binding protein
MSHLVVQDLHKQFPTRGEPLIVLRGVNLTLSGGENLAVLGPSGSGKSTLLHILGALDTPSSGTVTLDDHDPFSLNEPQLAAFRNRQIGFVFQDHHLLPQLSALENVLVPALAQPAISEAARGRAELLISRVGLADRRHHRPAELSGGERQRVAVARALIQGPTLLLADEPTGNLDRKTARQIGELLLELQAQERTMMIVATHSLELAAMCDRQMELGASNEE